MHEQDPSTFEVWTHQHHYVPQIKEIPVDAKALVPDEEPADEDVSQLFMSLVGALAWLANHLLARGDHLRKGDLVMSGATCGLTKVHPGDTVVASFDTTIQMGAVATVEVHMLAE